MNTNKLKILLIKVPEIDFEEKKIDYAEFLALNAPPIPLGIAWLSAYLKENSDHEVYILDIFMDGFKSYKETKNRDVFLRLIEEKIEAIMPDVICISALMIVNYKWVHYIANVAKKIKPEVKILVGGGYASLMPEKVLEDVNVDFAVMGEGEEALLNIINNNFIKEKLVDTAGVGFRNLSGGIFVNRDLRFIDDVDKLPFFDWAGINLDAYLKCAKDKSVSYITSRGCPFGCSFCSTHLMWGKKFRPLSAKRVLAEIDYLVSRYSIRQIEFRDDNLTLDRERIMDILTGFIEREYDLSWTCPNALAVITIDRKLLEILKESGCDTITIAIESGSEKVLKNIIHKPCDKNKVREIVKIAKDIGLKIDAAFVVGFPGETREDIEETRDFILELQCDWNQISIATPFPGTEIYDICEKNNYFANSGIDLERFRYGFANIRTSDFDEKWIKEKAYDINIEVNFLKNHNLNDNPEYAIAQFEDRLVNYPEHLIAIFCLTYAYKKAGENVKARVSLTRAFNLIKNKPHIYETYKKYMNPNDPIFTDYFKRELK